VLFVLGFFICNVVLDHASRCSFLLEVTSIIEQDLSWSYSSAILSYTMISNKNISFEVSKILE
jgi:hypothetical protein